MPMKLLTKEILRKLPSLRSTKHIPVEDKVLVCKFFLPEGRHTWYVVEYDGKDTFFGYVIAQEKEWGYFSLSQLQQIRTARFRLSIERDLYFEPVKFKDLKEMR